MGKETGLILLLCVSIAGVSFWMGRNYSFKEPVTVQTFSNDSYRTTLQGLEQKMRQISEVDFAEYKRLKDRKAQYEKAEEILAKIMGIFVADLGLRVAKSDIDKLAKHEHAVNTEMTPPPPPKPASATVRDTPDWKAIEAKLKDVHSEDDVDGFLRSAKVDNLFPTIRSFRVALRKDLDDLAGSYFGQIRYIDPAQRPKDIEMHIKLTPGGEVAEGEYEIKISQDGNVEGNSTANGKFGDAFSTGQSSSILVRTSPDNYGQLYWSSQLNQLFGNWYKKEAADKYSPVGTVFLRRR